MSKFKFLLLTLLLVLSHQSFGMQSAVSRFASRFFRPLNLSLTVAPFWYDAYHYLSYPYKKIDKKNSSLAFPDAPREVQALVKRIAGKNVIVKQYNDLGGHDPLTGVMLLSCDSIKKFQNKEDVHDLEFTIRHEVGHLKNNTHLKRLYSLVSLPLLVHGVHSLKNVSKSSLLSLPFSVLLKWAFIHYGIQLVSEREEIMADRYAAITGGPDIARAGSKFFKKYGKIAQVNTKEMQDIYLEGISQQRNKYKKEFEEKKLTKIDYQAKKISLFAFEFFCKVLLPSFNNNRYFRRIFDCHPPDFERAAYLKKMADEMEKSSIYDLDFRNP